jgi:cell division transport system permease protein
MRLRMLVSEALRSVTSNLSTTIAATMTVLISMFVLGLVIALGVWVNDFATQQKDKLLVEAYFCTALTCDREATPRQIEATRRRILAMPEVESAEFISSADALQIMKEREPTLVEGLASNPLPASYEITPRDGDLAPAISRRLKAPLPPGVEKVKDGEETQEQILYAARIIFIVSAIFVILLGVAAAMLIANTIRLSIFARRREIEVMKLVGATNWFVRGPFMVEGVLCALAGTVVALVLLVLGEQGAESLVNRDIEAIGFAWNATILLGVGLALGAAGSALTLRKFLRI